MTEEILNYLGITWADDTLKATIESMYKRGGAMLNSLCNTELDFEEEGLPKFLLFNFVRYEREGASHLFRDNYRDELTGLVLEFGVPSDTDEV